ncbi:MAG: transglutaminase domain-containing protein [Agriterribacter sp.]
MKLALLTCCLVLGLSVAKTQSWNNSTAGNTFTWLPDSVTHSSASLATFIQSNYKTRNEQLQVCYNWVATNIKYDDDSSYYFNWSVDEATKIAATLRRRKGVCENYASLFTDLSNKIGVPSYVVHGYSTITGDKNVAHSWSVVLLDNEWRLCDPTWDAGFTSSYQYYLTSPEIFVQTHIPFDPIWQLLEKPVGYKEDAGRNKTIFNYKDSIKAFLQADSLQQFISIGRRMKNNTGIDKGVVSTWQTYYRMNITIIGQEQNMQLYNGAVDDLNKATDLFNAYVQYRNNRFLPAKSDAAVEGMLKPISMLITDARKKLGEIGKIAENFQYDTQTLNQRLDAVSKRTEEQRTFLKKYLTAAILDKEKMLYAK